MRHFEPKKPTALAFALAIFATLCAPLAEADTTHVVARGHTLTAIANRYRVSVDSIIEANHLHDPKHLKVGESLRIPGVKPAPPKKGGPPSAPAKSAGKAKPAKPVTYAMRPKVPGLVRAERFATGESISVRVSGRGRIARATLNAFEKIMRSSGNQTHRIDSRLVSLVTTVSNHFGGRKLEIVSGFRPYSRNQHTKHSNHNEGKAIDFKVVGVPNEIVRDYCRTLSKVGVGYYPNSTFVHLDTRHSAAYWIDYSRPGEAPRYHPEANTDPDEGTSDVAEEELHAPEASEEDQNETPVLRAGQAKSPSETSGPSEPAESDDETPPKKQVASPAVGSPRAGSSSTAPRAPAGTLEQ